MTVKILLDNALYANQELSSSFLNLNSKFCYRFKFSKNLKTRKSKRYGSLPAVEITENLLVALTTKYSLVSSSHSTFKNYITI